MKKLIILAVVLMLACSLAACGGASAQAGSVSTPVHSSSPMPAGEDDSNIPAASASNPDGGASLAESATPDAAFGGNWPENEFTQLLPRPDFTLSAAASDTHSFSVIFTDATIDGVRAYTEQVKDAGFTLEASTGDTEVEGMAGYTYTAKNADGYQIILSFAQGMAGLVISKP